MFKAKLSFENEYLVTPKNQMNTVTVKPRVENGIKIKTSIHRDIIMISRAKFVYPEPNIKNLNVDSFNKKIKFIKVRSWSLSR